MNAAPLRDVIERSIQRTARRYAVVLQPSDVEDIAQDTLLALWLHTGCEEPNSVNGYAAEAARNCTIDTLRRRGAKKRGEKETVMVEDLARLPSRCRTPEENAIARQALRKLLMQCRELLPAKSFRVLVLVYLRGLDSAAAAQHLGCSRSAVDTVVHRARRLLARHGIDLQPRARS